MHGGAGQTSIAPSLTEVAFNFSEYVEGKLKTLEKFRHRRTPNREMALLHAESVS